MRQSCSTGDIQLTVFDDNNTQVGEMLLNGWVAIHSGELPIPGNMTQQTADSLSWKQSGRLLQYGTFQLIWEDSGALSYFDGDNLLWTSGTEGGGYDLHFDTEGRLSVTDDDGSALWALSSSNNKQGSQAEHLVISRTGVLELHDSDHHVIWSVDGLKPISLGQYNMTSSYMRTETVPLTDLFSVANSIGDEQLEASYSIQGRSGDIWGKIQGDNLILEMPERDRHEDNDRASLTVKAINEYGTATTKVDVRLD